MLFCLSHARYVKIEEVSGIENAVKQYINDHIPFAK
jgi:hypothetical protein